MASSGSWLVHLVLCAALHTANALRAKWTPAADGGPARFSKRYRDAQGIDDSKWYDDDDGDGGWFAQIFPSTPGGWVLTIVAAAALYVLYTQQRPPQGNTVGTPAGGGAGGAAGSGPLPWGRPAAAEPASEAARAAFLKRYNQ